MIPEDTRTAGDRLDEAIGGVRRDPVLWGIVIFFWFYFFMALVPWVMVGAPVVGQ